MLWGNLKQERDGAETVSLKKGPVKVREGAVCLCPEEGNSIPYRKIATLKALGCVCLLGSRNCREVGWQGQGV